MTEKEKKSYNLGLIFYLFMLIGTIGYFAYGQTFGGFFGVYLYFLLISIASFISIMPLLGYVIYINMLAPAINNFWVGLTGFEQTFITLWIFNAYNVLSLVLTIVMAILVVKFLKR